MAKYRIEIKWALIFMLMSIAWMAMEKALGWHDEKIAQHPYLTMLYMFPAILVYVLALREKKAKDYQGQMSWKQGFISGLFITVIVTILSPLNLYISLNYISPEYFANAIDYSVAMEYMTQEEAEAYFEFNNYVMQSTFGALIMGSISAAIIAIFVKSKRN